MMTSLFMSSHIVELKTVQCAAIKTLFEALKEILTDVNLIFEPTGLKIMAVDGSQAAIVHLKLLKENFNYYNCNVDKFCAGINTTAFYTMLKTIGAHDILTLSIDEDDENELFVKIENGVKQRVDKSWYRLLDIDQIDITIPPQIYDFQIKMPATEWQSICKIMKDIGTDVVICSHSTKLKIECVGDFGKKEITLMESVDNENGISSIDATNDNPNHMVVAKYSLKFLLMFTKATSLCNIVKMCMSNNSDGNSNHSQPIIIEYQVAALGILTFALCPKFID